MIDINNLCPSCTKEKNGSICSFCGFNEESYQCPSHHLKPKTILNGKYILGKAIGEGGFGITYVGYDAFLDLKVAIKEFFPNGAVSRNSSADDSITVFSGSSEDFFKRGRDKFINEAKTLAKFENLPGIVSVRDFFLENGTAYIVMEFIEGETLKDFIIRSGSRVPCDVLFSMIEPLMKSLSQIHAHGLIHRDISPDNIMITPDSRVVLLDFGAARDINMDGNKSLSIQLKPGYAPEEQYRRHGNQGPWTDVYALCATIYRAITGVTPLESLERVHNDTLVPISSFGVAIDPLKETAIMQGLAVNHTMRLQNIDGLYNALYNPDAAPFPSPTPPPVSTQTSDTNKNLTIALIACIIVAVASLVLMGIKLFSDNGHNRFDGSGSGGGSGTGTVTSTATLPTPTPTSTPVSAPVFEGISASSTRDTDYSSGVGVNYLPNYAVDGDYSTAWTPNRNLGLQPYIELYSATRQHVSGIRLSNGYFKSTNTYYYNRRISKVSVEYEGGKITKELTADAYRIMQDIPFGESVDTSFIRIQVLEVIYGKWQDIAISEIEVY